MGRSWGWESGRGEGVGVASGGPLAEDLLAVALALVFGIGWVANGWFPRGGGGGLTGRAQAALLPSSGREMRRWRRLRGLKSWWRVWRC